MKKIISVLLLTVFCTSVFSQLLCDQTLWTHVYKPERLTGDKKCTTIKGMVWQVKPLDDGSFRLFIKLDPGQPVALVNDKNVSLAKGCMVAEIICARRPIINADALKTCSTYESKVKVPALNDHVQLTGTYVLDTDPERGWYTLYPVTDLTVLPKR